MKPSEIFDVMDMARRARAMDKVFNPLFIGPAGVGKSQVVQQWCKRHELPFIDLRAAFLESPDLIGFPSIENKNGRQVTVHNIPDFWPDDDSSEGVLLLEEVNRGTTAVMNTFMQLLTDRKVHKYNLPEKWIIVSCINPEDSFHDTNTMDTALKNRFVAFEIKYDKKSFLNYMKDQEFTSIVQMYVESGTWLYSAPELVGDNPDVKYTSPRSIEQLDTALKVEIPNSLELDVYEAILGKAAGMTFFQFKNNEQPVTYDDLVNKTDSALSRLVKFADPKDYKNGHIAITISDIISKNEIVDELLAKVLLTLPADQSIGLLNGLSFKRKESEDLIERMTKGYPEVKKYLKHVLGGSKKKAK